MLNHANVPANQLAALAKELLDSTGDSEMNRQVAQTLLEAARAAQSAAGKREKDVIVQSPLMPLPAVLQEQLIESNLLPKERWLASFCQSEKAQRRRVLVYVRQTGTRDIQERIETVLKNAGLRVITLYSSVDPRKREAWIDRHADVDVLITNPRLVATGLDLVNFASVVFSEVEYSLYTLWQALRRVWRLGQTKPVKAVFSVYRGTMEAQALALMGRKMRAAQLLYGDNVGGAIVPVEDGDFITELAREVLRGAQLDDLQSLFADEMQMSNSPMGCPTETSPILVPVQPRTWGEWLSQRDIAGRMPASRRAGRRSSLEAPGQLSIWSSMKEK
jgi:SNF2 family DNA or RNA helicase